MEGLNKCGNENASSRSLGNGGSQSNNTGNGGARSGNPPDYRTEYPLINIFRLDTADEETLNTLRKVIKESNANNMNSDNDELDLSKDVWITVSERREIFPKLDEKTEKIHKLPEFRCCFVEHNYCQIKKNGLGTRAFKIKKSSFLNEQGKNTGSNEQSRNALKFENESGKKRTKEQTTVAKDSTTKHVDPNSNFDKTIAVNENLKRIAVRKVISSNSQQIGHTTNDTDTGENQDVKSTTPIICVQSFKGIGSYYDIIVADSPSMPPPVAASESDSEQIKQLIDQLEKRNVYIKAKRKSETHKRGISQEELIYKVVKMEDGPQERSLALSNTGGRNMGNAGNNDMVPMKIKKLSVVNISELQKGGGGGGGYASAKSTVMKTVPGDKKWNLEYVEDDVKNLGLDDLILKASEVNAENFTKALGRNSAGSSGNKCDSPEVLLSFPRSEGECNEPIDGDNEKMENIKKAKLEFLKKCATDDKVMEESLKNIPELPKKPGLKVKTVQNINAEFKDSLGAKRRKLEGQDIFSQNTIPVYTVDDDVRQFNRTKGILVPVGRGRVPVTQPVRLTCRSVNRQQDSIIKMSEISQETRPFIMTVGPNKNSPGNAPPRNAPFTIVAPRNADPMNALPRNAPFTIVAPRNANPMNAPPMNAPPRNAPLRIVAPKNAPLRIVAPRNAAPQMSARVASKVFIKPKVVFTQHGKLIPAAEGRPRDTSIIKVPEGTAGQCLKSGENIAVVCKPGSFEVVTVDDYPAANVKRGINSHTSVGNSGSLVKKDLNVRNVMHPPVGSGVKKKNIPILLCNKTQYVQVPLASNQKFQLSPDVNRQIRSVPRPQGSVVNISPQVLANIQGQRIPVQKARFTVSPIRQRVQPKNVIAGTGVRKYVQIVPNMINPGAIEARQNTERAAITPRFEEEAPVPGSESEMMTIAAFAKIMKGIIPEKWVLSLDRSFGLQFIKVHLDDYLNPSIMISVVVGISGKVSVNVRGRELERNHDFFSSLCQVATPNNKVSINYILSVISKLRYYNVCFGCDDLSLKKYWSEDGFIENYTEFQQTYRSHICESLVRLGRKRCHPCYRMQESLKKRRRREQLAQQKEMQAKAAENAGESCLLTNTFQGRGTKRNMEECMEEAFTSMRQKIAEEIERFRAEDENQRVPQTQDEVLGFIGLTRKQSLDVTVRKSKREKKAPKKSETLPSSGFNKEELYFLEKYWHEITVLFSTSLLVGAYSRTSMAKLKEKCQTFYRLLAMWRGIIRDNAMWVGGHFNLADNLVNEAEMVDSDSITQKFDSMDVPALRAYIINCVKEVNKMKNRLRTKNAYFRALYNNFLKPNMKKARQGPESVGSPRINMNLAAQREPEAEDEEITPDKFLELRLTTPPDFENSDGIGLNNGEEPRAQERVIIYV